MVIVIDYTLINASKLIFFCSDTLFIRDVFSLKKLIEKNSPLLVYSLIKRNDLFMAKVSFRNFHIEIFHQ